MRVLLDTHILIHREARTVVRDDIGSLFHWLDELKFTKCVHPGSLDEIEKHADPEVVRTLNVKLGSYRVLKTLAPDTDEIAGLRVDDKTDNDALDTSLLAELLAGRVDALITEDRGVHRKAKRLGLSSTVFTIDSFLEKVTAENPSLANYKVLAVKKAYFGNINLGDPFFDSFRDEYPGFNSWFNRKADETAYVCTAEDDSIIAFLYVKREGKGEDYCDIGPQFARASRLKIGTFKVISNGFKLGERFLKIAFDNAHRYEAEEIYVTAFRKASEQDRLIQLLEDWGFLYHGTKTSQVGTEQVFVRDFRPRFDAADPRRNYPYLSRKTRKFVVPIYPAYHTELLPDSILNTESPDYFVENKPNRNAISKVYVSRSHERGLRSGDIIVFYRTGSGTAPAHYTSVATTLGVVQDIVTNIPSKAAFIDACRKRSVFSDQELGKHWDYNPHNRPFIVNFLYVHSFPIRPNLKQLKDAHVIGSAPRGFEILTAAAFNKLLEMTNADKRLIVD
jgi:predicted nucleic acid-binding protein